MNVRATHLPQVPTQRGVSRPGLDVTVSDAGVRQLPPVNTAPVVEPVANVEPTSTPELAASLTTEEKAALTEHFAALPRTGVTGSGVYDPRGRTPRMSNEAQPGRLLDITG
jgi:hypothetical protein